MLGFEIHIYMSHGKDTPHAGRMISTFPFLQRFEAAFYPSKARLKEDFLLLYLCVYTVYLSLLLLPAPVTLLRRSPKKSCLFSGAQDEMEAAISPSLGTGKANHYEKAVIWAI